MEKTSSQKSKEKNEENKFKTTIHDMIYKLIEDEEPMNPYGSQDNQIIQNTQINSLNNTYLPLFMNNNPKPIPNMFYKKRNTFPDNNYIVTQKYLSNFNNMDIFTIQNIKRTPNRKKTYDTPKVGYNSKIEIEILINKIRIILEKNGKLDFYVYNMIKGKFLSIIKNHKGSKIFQKYIKPNNTSDEIIHLLFLELSKNLEEFMTNPYSNYFFKKFFICLNGDDRIYLLKKIEKSIVNLSLNEIGTYPIQTIIEYLSNKVEKMIIISAVKDHIHELIYNQYGSYVLEKMVSCMDERDIPFLYSFIANNFIQLAFNNNSICVIKKLLSINLNKYMHDLIKNLVMTHAKEFILHPCGNFVIQSIVEFWDDYLDIINLYINNLFNLSLEKYASNVIERFIERDERVLVIYIDEIVKNGKIYEIMKSKFGNYVIQKAIKLSKNESKKKLVFNAAFMINNLKDCKLIAKWKSILMPHINELSSDSINKLNSRNFFEL